MAIEENDYNFSDTNKVDIRLKHLKSSARQNKRYDDDSGKKLRAAYYNEFLEKDDESNKN